MALTVVLIAGLAHAIGQSVVLFINKIKPNRFVFSIAISAILFAFSYGFWALSTWFVSHVIFGINISFLTIARTLGLSYAPQMLGFLVGLPYVGIAISVLLSIWSLLAEITGLQVVTELTSWGAFACGSLGWLVLQILHRTVGRPLANFGDRLLDLAAGTKLVRDREGLEEIVMAGMPATVNFAKEDILKEAKTHRAPRKRPVFVFAAIALISFLLIILFSPISPNWLGLGYYTLKKTVRLTIDLTIMSVFALACSILLTPLEALGWWAGWSGEEPLKHPGTVVGEGSDRGSISRYIIYLDGINQGGYKYLPSVEGFLNTLADAIPEDMLVVKGIMPYSVSNRSLAEDRSLSFLWRIIDSISAKNPANPIGLIVNIRNVVAVAVAADPRYGPIQNQGLAQVLFNNLIHFGYQVGSKTPITLIGYSGGGQMSMGAVPFLKKATGAQIEIISLAGVISGNTGAMVVERLYHLVGKEDSVEKVGPIMFPGRWPIWLLSNWNRAKRRGKITFIDLGPVGHNGPRGPMAESLLPDGPTRLQQTVNIMTGILIEDVGVTGLDPNDLRTFNNYEIYKQGEFNSPAYYPLDLEVDSELYQPIGTWMGRLILPAKEERDRIQGVLLEIYRADDENRHRIGQVVNLRWSEDSKVQDYLRLVTIDLNFVDQVELNEREGKIHPDRIDGWENVDPLESLAGSRPEDDIVVMLKEPVEVEDTGEEAPSLYISCEPVQITGRYYGLVTIVESAGKDLFRVRHYNRESQKFDGVEEVIYIPTVVPDRDDVYQSSNRDLEKSPANAGGWYIYGAKNSEGKFVVQAIAPRQLFALKPDETIYGKKATIDYINSKYWQNVVDQKGRTKTVLLNPWERDSQPLEEEWKEGDRALLIHVYGGIGGNKQPDFAPMGIYFGHFAFGMAEVVRDRLTDELRFEIEYRQIYTHNPDGVVAGNQSWTRYMGDRQFGWLGSRPISDILVKFSPLIEDYEFEGVKFSPWRELIYELEVMTARYRIGDGTGMTFVSSINSCVQDSSQAMYGALRRMVAKVELNRLIVKWLREHPEDEQTKRFLKLATLVESLEKELTPMGVVRTDWKYDLPTLGTFPEETPAETLWKTLVSWPSVLPRLATDRMTMIFLQLGASVWVMRTNQVGGFDPDIEPIAPTDFGWRVPPIKKVKLL